jgi:hypothetical protein
VTPAAIEDLRAFGANGISKRVVAAFAVKLGVPVSGDQRVIARAAIDAIVAAVAVDDVIVSVTRQNVDLSDA